MGSIAKTSYISGQRLWLAFILIILGLFNTACQAGIPSPPTAPELEAVELDDTVEIAAGQTLYVPVYSYIFMVDGGRTINLTTTLSIRNTSPEQPLILTRVDYYDSRGNLVASRLQNPVKLEPLASTEFVVPQEDITGGMGASFLVEWVAQAAVSDPVVEAIMINTQGNQGLSFTSPGQVITTRP